MTFLNKILIALILSLLGLVAYYSINKGLIEDKLKDTSDSLIVSNQNKNYFLDQLNQVDSNYKKLSLKAENLQTVNSKLNKEIIILNIEITGLGDTITVLKKPTTVVKTDTTITIPFSGKQNKVSYDGNTVFYSKTDSSTYSINIEVDPTKYSAEVLYDSVKTIIMRVYADSTLIGDLDAVIDTKLLLLLKNNAPSIQIQTLADKVGLYGSIYYINSQLALKLGLYYEITNKLILYSNYKFNDKYYSNHFEIELQYRYPLSKLIK